MAEKFRANCSENIGCEHEIIIFDNRTAGYGICQVYNICAAKAKGDYLCFVHEDVQINTPNWGEVITRKLDEPSCGVVGFAGATIKSRIPSSWAQELSDYNMLHIVQTNLKDGSRVSYDNNLPEQEFIAVVGVDGVFLMMRRDVWQECNFDEQTFKHFHCYDLDISLQVAERYTNYVCNSVELEHFSYGSFNDSWFRESITLHNKWESRLPMTVTKVSDKELMQNERINGYMFTKRVLRSGLSRRERHAWLRQYLKRTHSLNMRLTAIGKCIRYSLFRA